MDFDSSIDIDRIPYDFELRCPRCNSKEVLISITESGYYEVIRCLKCNYQIIDLII